MRRTVTPLLPKGETRQTYTSCDAFYVSTDDPECPHMHLTKELLLCFVDLPQRSASDILGIHKCSLVNVRKKFGLPYWPYVKIMGGYWEMTKFQVVNHREAVIKRLLELVEKEGLPMDRDTYFECKQAKFFLGLLGAAVSKAFVYWRMHGRFANSELFQTHGSDGCFKAREQGVHPAEEQAPADPEETVSDASSHAPPPLDVNPPLLYSEPFWPLVMEQPPLYMEVEDVLCLGPIGQ
jgi:hypothetical protein